MQEDIHDSKDLETLDTSKIRKNECINDDFYTLQNVHMMWFE